jgi:hypothetical protein
MHLDVLLQGRHPSFVESASGTITIVTIITQQALSVIVVTVVTIDPRIFW